MEIRTITCQHVYNYGATLQAYALQTYLEKLGHNVEIIDYRLPTHMRYELFTPYPEGKLYPILKRFPLLCYIYCPIRNRKMYYTWGRKKSFDKFDQDYLHLTKVKYKTINELKSHYPVADIYIAGSDQIWNPEFLNGTDEGYYLNFGCNSTKRVAYAASFGVNELSQSQQSFAAQHLKRFDRISVRELSGLKILNNLRIKAELCVDPIFLLTKMDWINGLHLTPEQEDYIMLYDFTHDDETMRDFVLNLSREKGLKIVSVNDEAKTPYADIQINNAGPKEFLQYILNSKYVICNSFHATAFSIIFHKNFATFPLKKFKNSSRMEYLLQTVGLSRRFSPIENKVLNDSIDWNNVDMKINNNIISSKNFLDKALKS